MQYPPKFSLNRASGRAFTLIELLVVIAIIALLISILLPALGSARRQAQALQSGVNTRNTSQGITVYQDTYRETYPLSYVRSKSDGVAGDQSWDPEEQTTLLTTVTNYVHWSYFLFNDGGIPEDAFENPAAFDGGAPRTNPGPNAEDWIDGQLDDNGVGPDLTRLRDFQVRRMGYAVNGAIMPRNKLFHGPNRQIDAGKPVHRFVGGQEIEFPDKTILVTELSDRNSWRAISTRFGSTGESSAGAGQNEFAGNVSVKSHRPINPFLSFGNDGGAELTRTFQFQDRYSGGREPFRMPIHSSQTNLIGAFGAADVFDPGEDGFGSFDQLRDDRAMNAIWRQWSGRTNFAYADGHVETKELVETLQGIGEWGQKFYSIGNGPNGVATYQEMQRFIN